MTPSMLELMERDALEFGIRYIEDVNFELKEDVQAHLLIEIDGNYEKQMFEECEEVYKVLDKYKCDEILFADASHQKEILLKLRNKIGDAIKSNSVFKDEDTVVPRAELPKLLKGIKELGRKYNFKSVCFGHAGDGNLHVNIIRENQSDYEWDTVLKKGIHEMFELCVSLGGSISGEHGIGYTQKEFLPISLCSAQIEIMKKIKNVFDPSGILNPGKIFP